jgi:hypothetical protein
MEEKHLVLNRTIKFTWLENKSKCIKRYPHIFRPHSLKNLWHNLNAAHF